MPLLKSGVKILMGERIIQFLVAVLIPVGVLMLIVAPVHGLRSFIVQVIVVSCGIIIVAVATLALEENVAPQRKVIVAMTVTPAIKTSLLRVTVRMIAAENMIEGGGQ